MSNFMFLCHVLTSAVKFPFALSYFSCVPHVCSPPSPTLVSFALFCHTVLERVLGPVRLSLILLGEPDDGVRPALLTS